MALDLQRWNQRRFYFLVIDAALGRDDVGWQIYCRTPLFAFIISRHWISFKFVERRTNGVYLGFLARWPILENDQMYKWKWEREVPVAMQVEDPNAVPDPNQISPKFFNQVAQIAHFFAMYALTFTMTVFGGWPWALVAIILCSVYAFVHEFIWDPLEENAATRGSDIEDFLFLMIGGGVGSILGAVLIAVKAHGW